jgi:hypothetical protein
MADITNFNIGRGESFKILLEIINQIKVSPDIIQPIPQDITNIQFVGTMKETYSSDTIAAQFNVEKIEPYSSGAVFVSLTPEQTIALDSRKYVYNLDMVSGSVMVRRILEGSFMIRPTTTG